MPKVITRLYQAYDRLWLTPWSTASARVLLRLWGVQIDGALTIRGAIRCHVEGHMRIGDHVRIRSGPANYVGSGQRMAFWIGAGGRLNIERGCALSNSTIVCMNEITILQDTFVGGGSNIYDTDFHQLLPEARIAGDGQVRGGSIVIGPRAFIGGHSLILKNVSVGEGAVIGAGSVVTASIPPFEVWAGVPARFVKRITGITGSGS